MAKDEDDLSAFYVERIAKYREYLDGCLRLVDKAMRALQPHLGSLAKLSPQALKPADESQKQVNPNGILQNNGLAVFGYAVSFEAEGLSAHVVQFFLGVGKLSGQKGAPDEWYIGHEGENFPMKSGAEGQELDPLFAHIVRALEKDLLSRYPTEAVQQPQARKGPERRAPAGDLQPPNVNESP